MEEHSAPVRGSVGGGPSHPSGRGSLGFGRAGFLLLGGMALVYLLLSWSLPPDLFWSPDEGGKLLQIESYQGRPGQRYVIRYGGRDLDPGLRYYPHADPAHRSWLVSRLFPQPEGVDGVRFNWGHLFPVLSKLPYRLLGHRGLYLLPLLGGLLVAGITRALVLHVEPRAADPAAITVALGSPVLFYSLLFWEHTLAVALALAALYLFLTSPSSAGSAGSPGSPGHRRAGWGALLLALSIWVRLEMALFAVALGGALLLSRALRGTTGATRSDERVRALGLVAAVVSASLGLGALLVASRLPSGAPEPARGVTSLELMLDATANLVFSARFWASLPRRLLHAWVGTPTDASPVIPGALAAIAAVGLLLSLAALGLRGRAGIRACVAGTAAFTAVSLWVVVTPDRFREIHALGLPAPYLLLVPAALGLGLAAGGATRLLALASAIYLSLATAISLPGLVGGLEWGNRYALVAYPLGAVSAAVAVPVMLRRAGPGALRAALAGVAAAAVLTGALYQMRGYEEIARTKTHLGLYARVLDSDPKPTVTDLYWFPASLASRFVTQPIFTLAGPGELGPWIGNLPTGDGRFRLVTDPGDGDLGPWLESLPPGRAEILADEVIAGLRFTEMRVVLPGSEGT